MILAIKVSPMNHFLSFNIFAINLIFNFKVYGLGDAISAAVGCSLAASDNL